MILGVWYQNVIYYFTCAINITIAINYDVFIDENSELCISQNYLPIC